MLKKTFFKKSLLNMLLIYKLGIHFLQNALCHSKAQLNPLRQYLNNFFYRDFQDSNHLQVVKCYLEECEIFLELQALIQLKHFDENAIYSYYLS